jgi:tetratricopeptide (TPR) repeat protein
MVFVRNGSPRALEEIEELDNLGPRMWAIGALQLRSFYHLWRAETAQARRVLAKAELEFVRLGALWQMHAVQHSTGCIAYAVTGDVLGLKRSIEALSRHVEAGLKFEGHVAIARGEYLRLSGKPDEALPLLDQALAEMPPDEGLARPWALAARAHVLLDLDRLDEARDAGELAFAHASDPERAQETFRLRAGKILAHVDARTGAMTDGRTRLDALIRQAEALDNPYFAGDLREAACLLALDDGDRATAVRHCDAVEKLFVPSRNPGLVARYEKLVRLTGLGPSPEDPLEHDAELSTEVFAGQTDEHTIGEIMSILSRCGTAAARATRALEALVEATGAQRGFLYLLRGEDFDLVAPDEGAEPPDEVSISLHGRLEMDRDDDLTTLELRRNRGWRTVLLHAKERDGSRTVVGAAVLFRGEAAIRMPPPTLRNAIGQRLYDEGDVYTTVGTAH